LTARSQIRFWLVSWAGLAALWLLLVDTVKTPELVDGAVAAALGATVMAAVRAQRLVAFRPRARWLFAVPLVLPRAAADLGVLAAALFRRVVLRRDVRGGFRAVPFRHGGGGGEATARRVIAKLAGSFAPNTYVLDVDEKTDVILVHQLVSQPGRASDADPLDLG
jgi:multisubunit Na+/H+ antiporter MnhE subunit